MLRFTRATEKAVCGTPWSPMSAAPVPTPRTPKFHSPSRPVRRAPRSIGTVAPPSSPMRREKKAFIRAGSQGTLWGGPNSKMPAFSRKKSRFSGKKRENRVRFTCRSSTSTSAKSVL